MEVMRNASRVLAGQCEGKTPLEDISLGWTITLKSFLKNEGVAQTGLPLLSIVKRIVLL